MGGRAVGREGSGRGEGLRVLAQGRVIMKYVAGKLAPALVGGGEEDQLRSDQLVAFCADIDGDLVKCKYTPGTPEDKTQAWDAYLDKENARGLYQRRPLRTASTTSWLVT